jgi:hypothetical protein
MLATSLPLTMLSTSDGRTLNLAPKNDGSGNQVNIGSLKGGRFEIISYGFIRW